MLAVFVKLSTMSSRVISPLKVEYLDKKSIALVSPV